METLSRCLVSAKLGGAGNRPVDPVANISEDKGSAVCN